MADIYPGGGSGVADSTAANQSLQLAQETAAVTVLGATADAAVTTSVAGTISAKLRGIISLLVSGIVVSLKRDNSRTPVALIIDKFQAGQTAEKVVNTMSSSVGLAAATTGLSAYQVTSGKRFAIQTVLVNIIQPASGTTNVAAIVRIRAASGATATITSTVILETTCDGQATVNRSMLGHIPLASEIELSAADGICVTVEVPGYVVTTANPQIIVTILGYEYTP